MTQISRRLVATALAGALAAGLTGLAATPAGAAPVTTDLAAGGVHAPVPHLSWTQCTQPGLTDLQCTTARVPLDYDRPTGATIGVVASRRPADDQAHKIGTLFLNPGGPGGSGVEFVTVADFLFSPAVLARFDIVGLDPRGTNRSAPVRCFGSADEQSRFFADVPAFPVGVRETAAYLRTNRDYTRRCAQVAGPIIDHASTANFVRDLDLFRQAVGDTGFSYVGYSYGTYVGETYAALFPSRVRAVVIDGVLDPERWATGQFGDGRLSPYSTRILSAQGAYETLQAFFRTCAAAGPARCAFAEPGKDARQLAAKYAALANRVRRHPVVFTQSDGSTVTVTYAVLVSFTLGELYSAPSYPELAEVLDGVDRTAPAAATVLGRQAAKLADEPLFDSGFDAVACADSINPRSQLAWPLNALAQDRRFPYFGSAWTYVSTACATWPGRDTDRYLGPFTKRTARPVLVIGNRYDPATRYQAAVEVARTIPGARLLTTDGYGHTSIGVSACAVDRTGAYLLTGALPAPGTVCRPDRQPFDAIPAATAASTASTAVAAAALPPAVRQALAGAVRRTGASR